MSANHLASSDAAAERKKVVEVANWRSKLGPQISVQLQDGGPDDDDDDDVQEVDDDDEDDVGDVAQAVQPVIAADVVDVDVEAVQMEVDETEEQDQDKAGGVVCPSL